jgi:hypothetical protein
LNNIAVPVAEPLLCQSYCELHRSPSTIQPQREFNCHCVTRHVLSISVT